MCTLESRTHAKSKIQIDHDIADHPSQVGGNTMSQEETCLKKIITKTTGCYCIARTVYKLPHICVS